MASVNQYPAAAGRKASNILAQIRPRPSIRTDTRNSPHTGSAGGPWGPSLTHRKEGYSAIERQFSLADSAAAVYDRIKTFILKPSTLSGGTRITTPLPSKPSECCLTYAS